MMRFLEHELGLTWVTDDAMERASHALADDGRVWLVDPVDDAPALERAAALGAPQAVLQLLDRHNRDCAAIATRLGVPHLRLPEVVPGSPLECHRIVRRRFWNEVALWWPQRRALIVAEELGTAPVFAVGSGPVGVHPVLRLVAPGALRSFAPLHLLAGHGPPVHGDRTPQDVADALARSRQDAPRLLLRLPRLLRGSR